MWDKIRYHREYDALLCVGISPGYILCGAWSKANVTTGKAGKLVNMEKGTSAGFKLTKRIQDLEAIDRFCSEIKILTQDMSSS